MNNNSRLDTVEIATLDLFDTEQLIEAVRNSSLDHMQLSGGEFRGHLLRAHIGNCTLDRGLYSQALLARGGFSVDSLTVGCILSSQESGYLNGYRFDVNDIVVFPEGSELFYKVPANTQWVAFQIPRDSLEAAGFEIKPNLPVSVQHGRSSYEIALLDKFRVTTNTLLSQDADYSIQNLLGPQLDSHLVEQQFVTTIGCALEHFNAKVPRAASYSKRMAIARAVEGYLHDEQVGDVKITAVADAIGTSQRTLEYVFKDLYGVTPRRYLLNRRLNQVRKTLLLCDSAHKSIIDIAKQHGFNHPGRFAIEYKKLFNESPSQTLMT